MTRMTCTTLPWIASLPVLGTRPIGPTMTMTTEHQKAPDHAPSTEERWQVIERVAESTNLKRATRLKEFLFYVGKRSIKESTNDIHEQEIGCRVFGRKDSYDTSQDNIVRVSATELRKRIDAYFTADGKHEPLIFEIPRGSYTPVFRQRTIEPAAVPVPSVEGMARPEAADSRPVRPRIAAFAAISALAVALAITCGVFWRENHQLRKIAQAWEGQPALSAFWPQFFNAGRQTDIVLADTSYSLIQEVTHRSYSLTEYLNRSYLTQLETTPGTSDYRFLASLVARNSGSLGDFRVAQRIQSLDYGSSNVVLAYARDYSADSLTRDNVILIGSQKSNPWVELFADQRNFAIEYDAARGLTYVRNLHPRGAEQASYSVPDDQYPTLGYGVVSYLPTPDHNGSALIIEGTNSQATNAAGDFITSEDSLHTLFKKLPHGKIPYFEVLLRTTRVSGTPLRAEVIGYRIF